MTRVTIKDNKGRRIEVTNLNAAIEQAALFAAFSAEDPQYAALSKERQAYWQDIHNKLLQLQSDTLH